MDISQVRAQGPFVIRIGREEFPITGNAQDGWNIAAHGEGFICTCWYASLEELTFVLINLSLTSDGAA